jgi:biopolymer transport protein TolR
VRPQTPVLIRGDRQAAYNDIMQAMVLLQTAGVPSVGLVTQTPDTRKPGKK